MNTVINKFYTGNMNKFGFGTWNSGDRDNMLKLKTTQKQAPIPITQYKLQPTVNNYRPIPKTQSAMPNLLSNSFSKSITLPYRPEVPNPAPPGGFPTSYNTGTKYYTAENLKMQLLEEKIRQLEKQNKEEKDNIRDLIAMGTLPIGQGMPPQAMGPIPGSVQPINPMMSADLVDKRAARRNEIKLQIEEARKKLVQSDSEGSDDDDDESIESTSQNGPDNDGLEGDSLINSPGFKKRKNTAKSSTVISNSSNQQKNSMVGVSPTLNKPMSVRRSTILSRPTGNPNATSTSMLSKRKSVVEKERIEDEANEFINSIPQHIALQLQSENFKVRENLSMIKASFKDIRSDLQSKLDQIEMRQKINFENIRYVIEKGGNNKLKATIRKFLDNENIDLEEIEEEIPKYVEELPDLIDRKILENDKKRREEEEQRRMEEERMKENEKLILPLINNNGMTPIPSQEKYITDANQSIIDQRKEEEEKKEPVPEENQLKNKEDKIKKGKKRSKSKKKKKADQEPDNQDENKPKKGKKGKKKGKKENNPEGLKIKMDEDEEEPQNKKRAKSSKKKKNNKNAQEEEPANKSGKKRAKSGKNAKSKSKKKNKAKKEEEDEASPPKTKSKKASKSKDNKKIKNSKSKSKSKKKPPADDQEDEPENNMVTPKKKKKTKKTNK